VLLDTDDRSRLLFLLLLETGCGLQEAVSIRIGDARRAGLAIGVGKKQRLIGISPRLSSEIRRAIGRHPASGVKQAYLLATGKSQAISTRRVEQLLADLGRRTIGRPITPRMLRTTSIILAFCGQEPLESIERRTGLASVQRHVYCHFRQRWPQ
jgi:integrase